METLSERDLLVAIVSQIAVLQACTDTLQQQVTRLQASVDHADTGIHGVQQFIDQHLPLIRRFTDPGAAVRGFLPGGKRKGNGNG